MAERRHREAALKLFYMVHGVTAPAYEAMSSAWIESGDGSRMNERVLELAEALSAAESFGRAAMKADAVAWLRATASNSLSIFKATELTIAAEQVEDGDADGFAKESVHG